MLNKCSRHEIYFLKDPNPTSTHKNNSEMKNIYEKYTG